LNMLPDGEIPNIRSFVLGCRSTLRGYDPGSLPPSSNFKNSIVTVKTDSYFSLLKTEFRFPIYGNLGGAVFYDAGAVLISPIYEFRDTAGLGIRYNTPVGPVSLEYGQKLRRVGDEAPGRFHFSIGVF
jgi:outer membrane protein insertion porin family